MISYITNNINDPWSKADIARFEEEGSQRDKIVYNSAYNARISLTDKNIYLCSIKQKEKYQNFYLLGVTRSLFYFFFYIPQMEHMHALKEYEFTQKCVQKLALTEKCLSCINGSCEINENISICDGCVFFIKVNANIGEFLFPRSKMITNREILDKFNLMNKTYKRAIKEYDAYMSAIKKYSDKIDEQQEKIKKTFTRMIIRNGIIHGVPALLGIPGLSSLLDLDSLFGMDDMLSAMDMCDSLSIVDMLDISDDLLTV